jgi:hypothetical protein
MEFDQYVEYRTETGVYHVTLTQHDLSSPYTLAAVQQGYQHVAQLGRSVQLSSAERDAVVALAAETYHQDVIDNEITSDDPEDIVNGLAWVRSRPEWRVGLDVVPPDNEGQGGVYYNGADGNLYRCVQAHTAQADWRPDLEGLGALWARYYTEEWPQWVKPTGAHDAYDAGAKVTYNDSHWVNDIDANVWRPDVYGWTEQV